MILSECLLIRLSQILQSDDSSYLEDSQDSPHTIIQAQHEWNGAIAAIQKLLTNTIDTNNIHPETKKGIIISSPTPIINDIDLVSTLETVVFSSSSNTKKALMPCEEKVKRNSITPSSFIDISLDAQDILQEEQFCLVFTDKFACALVKTETNTSQDQFYFSFTPEVINKVWYLLKIRLMMNNNCHHDYVQELVNKFTPYIPPYQIISQFTRHLLTALKQQELSNRNINFQPTNQVKNQSINLKKTPLPPSPELELLQALTHEIRTPLTTIKTVTKLLKRKAKYNQDLKQHLEVIEQECTEQINRMELIFQAVELESKGHKKQRVQLVNTCLENILNQSISHWKKQAQRRNIVLDIAIPQKLPHIVSEPKILSQALSGLMERFIRNLPSGGHFKVLILPVGNQLKLQFLSECNYYNHSSKCLGKLLLFQPETGSLSLSNDVTKNLFHILGGKLTFKQKADKGEVLTIFLPLNSQKQYYSHNNNSQNANSKTTVTK